MEVHDSHDQSSDGHDQSSDSSDGHDQSSDSSDKGKAKGSDPTPPQLRPIPVQIFWA